MGVLSGKLSAWRSDPPRSGAAEHALGDLFSAFDVRINSGGTSSLSDHGGKPSWADMCRSPLKLCSFPDMETSAHRRVTAQPWRRQRRTAAAGHCALTLITRTRDPLARSISACEQISSSMSVTSISVVGSHCKVLGISPGQMRHAEPSLSSTKMAHIVLLDLHRRSPV